MEITIESESMRSIMAELQKSLKACCVLSVSVAVLLLWLTITATLSMAATRIVPVGVILDQNSGTGYMLNNTLAIAIEDYYSAHNNTATKIQLIIKHVSQNDVRTVEKEEVKVTEVGDTTFDMKAASDLIEKHKVHAILGPQNSEQARYIVKLGEENQVPVIWFPITGPSLLPPPSPYSHKGPHCFQFQAIAAVIKALGWHSIIPIYEDTEHGNQLISCLPNVLKVMGIRMANVTAIESDIRIINSTLDKLKAMRTQEFLVHMSTDFGIEFIKSAQIKRMMGEGYAWILTQELSSVTDPHVTIRQTLKGYMQGAIGVRPKIGFHKTQMRRDTERKFMNRFYSSLSIYGWWAYHTIEALAKALEKPSTTDNGPALRREILATTFTGNSGIHFDLNKGPLDQSVLEVYNVVGQRDRIIGSWSHKNGLAKNISEVGETSDGDNEYPLEFPLWPGDSFRKPPKLRIGVPITNSFPEFVNVDTKPRKGGLAINVFLKALEFLPFPLNYYKFVPLSKGSTSDTHMTYDDMLCRQMKDEDLDAIIGDITIVEDRTKCVDFTLPYLDSSVVMVVRAKRAPPSKRILFKPFSWLLWLILGGIFVGATIIIIILERNKAKEEKESPTRNEANEEKKTSGGSAANEERKTNKEDKTSEGNKANEENKINEVNKADEFLFHPFLVYKMDAMEFTSRAARWMVILTSFLFILVLQVYTANLTSILTKGNMKEPSFKNENELKTSNRCVGYRNGSWVRGLLIEQIGFPPSQLKALGSSREEYNESLSKGTEKGGVDAIFDETPYLMLFLSKYKSDFMMTGSIYKTGGFGFAFPKKSSLVLQFSNAILKVAQDVESYRVLLAKSFLPTTIEELEFEDQNDEETPSLSIDHFGGLYPVLISVVALFLGLSISLVIEQFSSVIKWLHEKILVICPSVIGWFCKKPPFKLTHA